MGKLLEPKPRVDIRMRQAHAHVEMREPRQWHGSPLEVYPLQGTCIGLERSISATKQKLNEGLMQKDMKHPAGQGFG